jgi:hypothetical protein
VVAVSRYFCLTAGGTYLTLLILRAHAVTLQYSELAVEQQLAEAFNTVALPVFYQSFQLFNSFDALFTGDSIVCTGKDRRGCVDTTDEIFFPLIIEIAVLLQLLWMLAKSGVKPQKRTHRK